MIDGLKSVMLYVDNQEQSIEFWTETLGFVIRSENYITDEFKSVEVAPTRESGTSIVIFDKEFIREVSPEVNLNTPSLMFQVKNLNTLYEDLNSKGIKCGDIVETPNGRVFNFSDHEDNYFAVNEVK